jgi:surface antigen
MSMEFTPPSAIPRRYPESGLLTAAAPAREVREGNRPQIIHLGVGYLLALAAIGILAELLAPDFGPLFYGALLLLLVLHTAISWERPFRCLPLLLALAPAGRLVLSALGTTHPAARALALGLPLLAALTTALRLLGIQLSRVLLPQPLPEAERPQSLYLSAGYLLALAAVGVLAELVAPDLGPLFYGALLLLLALHAALSWERPFRGLPLLLSLAPVGRLALFALGTVHPASRTLALGLPLLAALTAAVGLLDLRITLPSLRTDHLRAILPQQIGRLRDIRITLPNLSIADLQSILPQQIGNLRGRFRFLSILLRRRLVLRLRSISSTRFDLVASRGWTILCQWLCEQGTFLQRLFPVPRIALTLHHARVAGRRFYRAYINPIRAILSITMILAGFLAFGPGEAYIAAGSDSTVQPAPKSADREVAPRGEIQAEQHLGNIAPRSPSTIPEQERKTAQETEQETAQETERHYGLAPEGDPGTSVPPGNPAPSELRRYETMIIEEVEVPETSATNPPAHPHQEPTINHQNPVPDLPEPEATPSPVEVNEESLKSSETTAVAPTAETVSVTYVQTNGQNPYPWGQCTWYAWSRRPDLPWFAGENGHARGWAISAQAYGIRVDSTPAVGAIAVFQPWVNGGHPVYGHVAYVEKVRQDGLLLSECNMVYEALLPDYPRWWEGGGACGYRFIPFDQLDSSVQFIH